MIFSQDILEYIRGLEKRGWRLGLDRIKAACGDLENPQNAYPIVIVAGTNGKGSASCILQKLTRAHGLKTGLYTSPSLKSLNERIVVNGEAISEAEFKSLALRLVKISEKHSLSQFEFLTLMAFEHFRASKIAMAVVEVGMGGRLDATNAVDASTAIITPIGIDHSEHLGTDVAQIAREKSGVIKREATVVCAQQDPSALQIIRKAIAENEARMISFGDDFKCVRRHPSELASPEIFDYEDRHIRLDSLELGLRGVFQPSNASLALAALSVLAKRFNFELNEKAIRGALAATYWPARFDVLPGSPNVILDGAHNPHGASALAETLRERARGRAIFVYGALADKDVKSVTGLLAPLAEEAIITSVDSPRAMDPVTIKRIWDGQGVKSRVVKNPDAALEVARERAVERPGMPVVACGSLYLVGGYLDPGWKL